MRGKTQQQSSDRYFHCDYVPMKKAKETFDQIKAVYQLREDVAIIKSTSTLLRMHQQVGDQKMIIFLQLERKWWQPWKARVKEEAFY